MQASLITFIITGVLLLILSIPLIIKKVKMNSWYGIRTPITSSDERIWYKVNSIMGRYLFVFGLLLLTLSLHYYINYTEENFFKVYILLFILIFGSILFIFLSKRVSYKIYKEFYE